MAKNQEEKNLKAIVGIGASAGGLQALIQFFSHLPDNTNMAFVVILHRSGQDHDTLSELIQNKTEVKVVNITDGIKIKPNTVYICPPQKDLSIYSRQLHLFDLKDYETQLHPIDSFFKSLAHEEGRMAACIIMSGTGSDGTLGMREINANNGLSIIQSVESADYTEMPNNAIRTGLVDFVKPPDQMPQTLMDFYSNKYHIEKPGETIDEEWLTKIFSIMKKYTGHDFSLYKRNTLVRRIARRMGLNNIENKKQYIKYLNNYDNEKKALFSELLIGLTSFFREPDAFETLKQEVLSELIGKAGKDNEDNNLRVWVPGCHTGEEAYSICIIIKELLYKKKKDIKLQIFGTDLNKKSIEKAREGLFPESIEDEVSKDRLNRFFSKEDSFYRVKREVREAIIFSEQNILKDPPFINVHLISCRNLLIYLNQEAQKKVLPLFHYTLNKNGYLMLGPSETIGQYTNLFESVNTQWKIFRKKDTPSSFNKEGIRFPITSMDYHKKINSGLNIEEKSKFLRREKSVKDLILNNLPYTYILLDKDHYIQYIQGDSGTYLKPSQGFPSQDILDMAREGLKIELSTLLRKAKSDSQEVTRKGVKVKTNGEFKSIDINIKPIEDTEEISYGFLLTFSISEKNEIINNENSTEREKNQDMRIIELEKELQDTRQSYRHSIEDLETSFEEIKSMNEELQSSNEELKSSKEELHSLNEELSTVNSELQEKVTELQETRDDMQNLLQSTQISTVFLDKNLNIRRFTDESKKLFNFIHTDIGRPFYHVSNNLREENITADVKNVLKELTPISKLVRTNNDYWYKMKIMPYRTKEDVIDGVVVTFFDINELEFSLEFLENIFNRVKEPLLVMDDELTIVKANESFFETFQVSKKETIGHYLYNLGNGQWNIQELRENLNKITPKESSIINFEVEHNFETIGEKKMQLNASKLKHQGPKAERILLAIEDIT
jgi:two-component system CheB/CheR fusion protein